MGPLASNVADAAPPVAAPDLGLFNPSNNDYSAIGFYNFEEGNANFLKFKILSLAVAADTGSVSPAPEPEIYAMMAVGLGLMGWTARRKKARVALA